MKLTLGSDAEQIIQDQLRTRKFISAEAVVMAGLKSLLAGAPDEFDSGEMASFLAEGEESIAREGTLDADQALESRRRRRRRSGGGGV